ncbi:MAG TPA: class I SAM-dependent methyltransferase [Bacillales bacterium]|nr:class I SAM-dependent methyltransferase [Bacillales bacterium]
MGFKKRFSERIDSQHGKPKGFLGLYIGEKMVRQHRPETCWTLKLLNPQQNDRVLELGCGAGYAMKQLLKKSIVEQVVGLDLSQTVLQSAKMRNRKEINKGRAKLVQGHVNQLAFQDGSFTKVFSIHSVYFWNDLSAPLSEIYRVLMPGGKIIVVFCNGKNGEAWNGIEQKMLPMLKLTGFKNVELLKGPDSREFHTVAVIGEKEKCLRFEIDN